jgi:hypothetical protein
MTKNKKNIADFQKALQSKAQFIVPDANEKTGEIPAIEEPYIETSFEEAITEEELLLIDEEIATKLKLLAAHSGRGYDEVVRHALTHFLMLKGLRLRDALMELYKKDISLKDL